MKILLVIDTLKAGGKERRMLELIKGLLQRGGFEIEIVVLSNDIYYNEISNLNIKVHQLIRRIKKDPTICINLSKICKSFKPDIIHSWEPMATVYSAIVAKCFGIKLINSMITNAPEKLSFKSVVFSKLTFPFSDIILSNSIAGLKAYNVPMKKSRCIHNGFNFQRISKLADTSMVKEKFNIKTEKVVGMVGAMSKRKDYETFLNSAMRILEKRNDVTFLAVGDGENYEQNYSIVKDMYKDRIIFTGNQSNVESIINVFNVGILTTESSIHGEGISNSILEYMALGKPVIATDTGGTKEILIDEQTGYLIRPHSEKALTEKIEYLLDNSSVTENMGKAGRQKIEDEFNIDKMIDSFIDVYNLVLRN